MICGDGMEMMMDGDGGIRDEDDGNGVGDSGGN